MPSKRRSSDKDFVSPGPSNGSSAGALLSRFMSGLSSPNKPAPKISNLLAEESDPKLPPRVSQSMTSISENPRSSGSPGVRPMSRQNSAFPLKRSPTRIESLLPADFKQEGTLSSGGNLNGSELHTKRPLSTSPSGIHDLLRTHFKDAQGSTSSPSLGRRATQSASFHDLLEEQFGSNAHSPDQTRVVEPQNIYDLLLEPSADAAYFEPAEEEPAAPLPSHRNERNLCDSLKLCFPSRLSEKKQEFVISLTGPEGNSVPRFDRYDHAISAEYAFPQKWDGGMTVESNLRSGSQQIVNLLETQASHTAESIVSESSAVGGPRMGQSNSVILAEVVQRLAAVDLPKPSSIPTSLDSPKSFCSIRNLLDEEFLTPEPPQVADGVTEVVGVAVPDSRLDTIFAASPLPTPQLLAVEPAPASSPINFSSFSHSHSSNPTDHPVRANAPPPLRIDYSSASTRGGPVSFSMAGQTYVPTIDISNVPNDAPGVVTDIFGTPSEPETGEILRNVLDRATRESSVDSAVSPPTRGTTYYSMSRMTTAPIPLVLPESPPAEADMPPVPPPPAETASVPPVPPEGRSPTSSPRQIGGSRTGSYQIDDRPSGVDDYSFLRAPVVPRMDQQTMPFPNSPLPGMSPSRIVAFDLPRRGSGGGSPSRWAPAQRSPMNRSPVRPVVSPSQYVRKRSGGSVGSGDNSVNGPFSSYAQRPFSPTGFRGSGSDIASSPGTRRGGDPECARLGPMAFSAVRHNTFETVERMLRENPAIVDAVDESNKFNTLLHVACSNGYARIAKLLIKYGANADAVNAEGNTPLHVSYQYGRNALVSILIAAHADENARNRKDQVPAQLLSGSIPASLVSSPAKPAF